MASNHLEKHYNHMMDILRAVSPSSWVEISAVLIKLDGSVNSLHPYAEGDFPSMAAQGTAFITFDYGIDGVSIEIGKYAQALERVYKPAGKSNLHFIGGDFYPQADSVLKPRWKRYRIEGINGWSKWDGGKWFSALFYEHMAEESAESKALAKEVYSQAVSIADRLASYLVKNNVALLIPVNIASNPGNLALTLGFTFVAEGMGYAVINSNHDFYWEGGKPEYKRGSGKQPGVRDHFFKNLENKPFFDLFQSLYPWNGRYWIQANINKRQSNRLIKKFGFPKERVFKLGTSVSDRFFQKFTPQDTVSARQRMGLILSDGESQVHPIPVHEHLKNLKTWIADQQPCVLGNRSGLTFDPTAEELIYLLQPTRVIARKRIYRDLQLIGALLSSGSFRKAFRRNPRMQLVLHITGPTPPEHAGDLRRVLRAYIEVLESVPQSVANRVFLAFSVGREYHPSFRQRGFKKLTIVDIYRMATAVLFLSRIEGRGLPLVESSACGVPIISSRYKPKRVFAAVVGENLPEKFRLYYTRMPEGQLEEPFLEEVSRLLLNPAVNRANVSHNRRAVRKRYSKAALSETFHSFINYFEHIYKVDQISV